MPLLVHAMASGAEDLATLLIKHGANVDATAGGVAPLLLAAQAGSAKLVQLLVQKGADLTAASDSGVTPLMILAAAGHVRGVRMLLEAAKAPEQPPALITALVDATTENGTAALHTAARQAHVKVVSDLLEAGASVALSDLGGQSALGAAYDGLQVRWIDDLMPSVPFALALSDQVLAFGLLRRACSDLSLALCIAFCLHRRWPSTWRRRCRSTRPRRTASWATTCSAGPPGRTSR